MLITFTKTRYRSELCLLLESQELLLEIYERLDDLGADKVSILLFLLIISLKLFLRLKLELVEFYTV